MTRHSQGLIDTRYKSEKAHREAFLFCPKASRLLAAVCCLHHCLHFCLSIPLSVYTSVYTAVYTTVYTVVYTTFYTAICVHCCLCTLLSVYTAVYTAVNTSVCLHCCLHCCLSTPLSILLSTPLSTLQSILLSTLDITSSPVEATWYLSVDQKQRLSLSHRREKVETLTPLSTAPHSAPATFMKIEVQGLPRALWVTTREPFPDSEPWSLCSKDKCLWLLVQRHRPQTHLAHLAQPAVQRKLPGAQESQLPI